MWGIAQREEEEEKDCLRQFQHCPACDRGYNIALILPCSHPMCARCVSAGEEAIPRWTFHHGRPQPPCAVHCPCCRQSVELPCQEWSSAASCLPKHPTLRSAPICRQTATEVGLTQGDQYFQWKQGVACEKTPHHCSCAASSSIPPLDGAIDLQDEEMEQSVYGLRFALDPSSTDPSLHLSNSSLTVIYLGETPCSPPPKNTLTTCPDPYALPGMCVDVVLVQGQYYWEVDVCNSSIYRIGVISLDGSSGWWLQRHNLSNCVVYDGRCEWLRTVPPQIKTIGVFLNIGGGTLSFYNSVTQEHLTTLPTRFHPAGVIPSLGLGQGKLRLRCGLPPPPHVFFSRDSAYREPCSGSESQWRKEVSFQSVRKVIEKFEDLALTNSSSNFGSSTTL